MTNIPLTVVLPDRQLTVVRLRFDATPVSLSMIEHWVDDTDDHLVDDTDDHLVFNYGFDANPQILTVTLPDRHLTVERL